MRRSVLVSVAVAAIAIALLGRASAARQTDETLLAVVRVLAAESDEPVAGARIALERSQGGIPLGAFATGLDGQAKLEFEAVACHARIDAEGYVPQRVLIADGRSAGTETIVVRLRRAAALSVRVVDESTDLDDEREVRDAQSHDARGDVRDAQSNDAHDEPTEGDGLAGLAVILTARTPWTLEVQFDDGSRGPAASWEAVTGPDGMCSFESLPPEVPLALEIRRAGELVKRAGKPVTLAGGETRSIEMRLGVGSTIRGRILDQEGRPAIVHAVALLAADGRAHRPIHAGEYAIARTATDGAGNFAFHDVEPRSWWVGPVAGYTPFTLAGLPELVELEPGAVDRELDLRAHRGLFVEGRVVDERGAPVGGAFVYADSVSAHSSEAGAFRLGPLLPGAHDLKVWAAASPQSAPAKVEAGAKDVELEVALLTGALRVEVRDGAGRPARARVQVWKGDGSSARDDFAVGRKGFGGLLPGTYTVVASSDDACAVARTVAIEAGRATELELVLAPAARLTVRYVGASAWGRLEVRSGDALVSAADVAAGTSSVCSVPPGALRIAMTRGGVTQEREIEARVGELVEVAFE